MHDIDFIVKFIFFGIFLPSFSIFLIVLVLNRCAIYGDSRIQNTLDNEIHTLEDQLPVYEEPPPQYKLQDFQV